jgi:hypothetical protein
MVSRHQHDVAEDLARPGVTVSAHALREQPMQSPATSTRDHLRLNVGVLRETSD